MSGNSKYVGPGPCEFHNCPLAEHCKAQRLACDAFAQFVYSGKVIDPTREFVTGSVRNSIQFTGEISQPVPSRRVFNQIYNNAKAA